MNRMLAEGTFATSVFIVTPVVENVPYGCEEIEVDYFNELQAVYGEIIDLMNFGSFFYTDIIYRIMSYCGCSNSIFADYCF